MTTETIVEEPLRITTTTEALLAVVVEYLEKEVGNLRYVLGGVLHELYGQDRCDGADRNDWPAFAMSLLYPDDISPQVRGGAARPAPFPPHWLGEMARTGRTLAQVAGTRAEAARRVERAVRG